MVASNYSEYTEEFNEGMKAYGKQNRWIWQNPYDPVSEYNKYIEWLKGFTRALDDSYRKKEDE